MADQDFPTAQISTQSQSRWLMLSRMWLVTIACLLFAIGLAWSSLEAPGIPITIQFPEGHGLKEGDSLRHRGIDIGYVESVLLDSSLSGIEVKAVLNENAAAIASEGSRFWIVRPQVGISGISGLETAVGSKYIAVKPGQGERANAFEGMSSQPPDRLGNAGIEIILRGDDRYGVNPGSPLVWRGVEVGQVLSSSLSPDAMHVDTRVRVREPFRKLVSRQSKFWATSGIHMGLDMSGFELSTESLTTIAKGGIAFITPKSNSGNQSVRPGDVFTLHKKSQDEWLESAAAIDLLELTAPPVQSVMKTWTERHFGIPRSYESHASALTIQKNDGVVVAFPSDMLPSSKAEEVAFSYQGPTETCDLSLEAIEQSDAGAIATVSLTSDQYANSELLDSTRIRIADGLEDCFAIRRSWSGENRSTVVIEMIGQHQLMMDGDVWRCSNLKLSRDLWHGAAVVSSQDEKVIGMLIVTGQGPVIYKLP